MRVCYFNWNIIRYGEKLPKTLLEAKIISKNIFSVIIDHRLWSNDDIFEMQDL